MLFQQRLRPGIEDGSITLAFRHWKRPSVRVHARRRLGPAGMAVIDAVETASERDITETDAKRAGYEDRDALLDELAMYASDDTTLYRIEFHYQAEPDARMALAANNDLTPEEADAVIDRLDRMDRASTRGPWTAQLLSLIESNPRVVAGTLATRLGRERLSFKADVRKLKALGLTISHEVGYEISPRGRAVLARMQERSNG